MTKPTKLTVPLVSPWSQRGVSKMGESCTITRYRRVTATLFIPPDKALIASDDYHEDKFTGCTFLQIEHYGYMIALPREVLSDFLSGEISQLPDVSTCYYDSVEEVVSDYDSAGTPGEVF